MLTINGLEKFHQASKTIEEEGVYGYGVAVKLIGKDAALALLLGHLRNQHGAEKTFPSDPDVVGKVNNILQSGLIAL